MKDDVRVAMEALSKASGDEEKSRMHRIVDDLMRNIEVKENQMSEESVAKFDTPMPKESTTTKNTDKSKKKRTFGKRSVNDSRGSSKRGSAVSTTDSERASSIASKKAMRISDVSDIPASPVVVSHKVRKPKEEIVEVMPTFDATPEAVPQAIYPVLARPSSTPAPVVSPAAPPDVQVETTQPAAEVATSEMKPQTVSTSTEVPKPTVLVITTGEGFTYQGRWKFDWLEISGSEAKSDFPDLVLSQPPEVLAYRTDMGAEGSLVRCY
jgi:hypothetical protein